MEAICKSAVIQKAAELDEGELALINAQALRPMASGEVFAFRLAACDNLVDRDYERFTDEALESMAKLYVGKPVLRDHRWNSECQAARVYAANVESCESSKQLVLRCYMPRTEGTAETITAIESGVIRECSVGVRAGKCSCSVCGTVQQEKMCVHWSGREYDGKLCHFDLDDIKDAYEVSLVAVPAQPAAGIVKSKRYGGAEAAPDAAPAQEDPNAFRLAKARLEMEKIRYDNGGN